MFVIRKQAAAVILLNRKSDRADESFQKLQEEKKKAGSETQIFQVACDLMDFASIKTAAGEVNEICHNLGGLNVLANNAGIMAFPDERTKDGFDVQMQTNHLSHFLLTKLVFPSFDLALENGKEVRICQQSSGARYLSKTNHEAKYFEKSEKGTLGGDSASARFERYHQTKLANMTFAFALHKKLIEKGYDDEKIKSVVGEPGISNTSLAGTAFETTGFLLRTVFGCVRSIRRLLFERAQSAADGSLPLVHACFAKEVASGDFFLPENTTYGKPVRSIHKGVLDGGKTENEKSSLDDANHEMCWKKSEEIFGDFFEFAAKH